MYKVFKTDASGKKWIYEVFATKQQAEHFIERTRVMLGEYEASLLSLETEDNRFCLFHNCGVKVIGGQHQ